MRAPWSLLLVTLPCLVGCPRGGPSAAAPSAPPAPFEDRYPEDIALPPGVEYPCAVTALPRDLAGVPEAERNYVNHVYAALIDVVQQKQVLLAAMARRADAAAADGEHRASTERALAALRAEPVPRGLEGFHGDVVAALEQQRTFFDQAVPRRAAGASMEDVHHIAEGRAASQRLLSAWAAMERRYPRWSAEVKDSVYHHLCALDLF
ncbi:MAG: hypothetical protein M9894_16450 [Planctomycetes bacterium]|nr:hypothetical protein [Planctomycetota bacterium]